MVAMIVRYFFMDVLAPIASPRGVNGCLRCEELKNDD